MKRPKDPNIELAIGEVELKRVSSYLHSIAVVTVAYSIGSRARTDEQGYNRWAPAASCRARCDVCSDRPSEDAVIILYQRFRDERRAPGDPREDGFG